MRADLRYLHSPTVDDLREWSPPHRPWSILVQLMCGPQGEGGEESFDVEICSADWLAHRADEDGVVDGSRHVVVSKYDYDALERYLRRRVEQAEGPDWHAVAAKLSQLGHWEFDDYQPYRPPRSTAPAAKRERPDIGPIDLRFLLPVESPYIEAEFSIDGEDFSVRHVKGHWVIMRSGAEPHADVPAVLLARAIDAALQELERRRFPDESPVEQVVPPSAVRRDIEPPERIAEAAILAEMGAILNANDYERIPVEVPARLAALAVAAWERDDEDEVPSDESAEARQRRHDAGTLALIGTWIQEHGEARGDVVRVSLPPQLLGLVLDSSNRLPPPEPTAS